MLKTERGLLPAGMSGFSFLCLVFWLFVSCDSGSLEESPSEQVGKGSSRAAPEEPATKAPAVESSKSETPPPPASFAKGVSRSVEKTGLQPAPDPTTFEAVRETVPSSSSETPVTRKKLVDPTSMDRSTLKPISIPRDGWYPGKDVEGLTVPGVRIRSGGKSVRVDIDGFRPLTWEREYSRKSELPKGYFDTLREDTNGDGDLADELSEQTGLWVMDTEGNITRFSAIGR